MQEGGDSENVVTPSVVLLTSGQIPVPVWCSYVWIPVPTVVLTSGQMPVPAVVGNSTEQFQRSGR